MSDEKIEKNIICEDKIQITDKNDQEKLKLKNSSANLCSIDKSNTNDNENNSQIFIR